jgi:hypothetical protein
VYHRHYATREDATQDIFEPEVFYDRSAIYLTAMMASEAGGGGSSVLRNRERSTVAVGKFGQTGMSHPVLSRRGAVHNEALGKRPVTMFSFGGWRTDRKICNGLDLFAEDHAHWNVGRRIVGELLAKLFRERV